MIGGALLRRRRRLPDADLPRPRESATLRPGELPVLSAGALVARTATADLIEALRPKLGLPAEHFECDVWRVIAAYAEFVQLLPASESHHHAGPGGLFTHALEVAGLALDARRGQILPRGAVAEAVGEQGYRWTYAVFVAALLHDVGRPLAHLRVLMRNGTISFTPRCAISSASISSTRRSIWKTL